MRKFTVKQTASTEFFDAKDQWAAFDVRDNIIAGPYDEEWMAHLYGTHAACRKPLFSTLGFKAVKTGSTYRAWEARPFYGIHAIITKHPQTGWTALVTVDSNPADARAANFKTRTEAAKFVNQFGDGKVMTRNILNPEAGEFPISRRDYGGCTDPGTERYHCM